MSLTNPNTPVSQQDLQDFYHKLLPYMGGSVKAGFTPIGTIISVMGTTAPANYLACDGTVYNIADYKELANYFNEQFGSKNFFGGDGTTTFAVPDLRGEFLRGTGTNSHTGNGDGASVGEHQDGTTHNNFIVSPTNNRLYGYTTTKTSNQQNLNKDAEIVGVGYVRADGSWTDTSEQTALYTSRPTNTSVLYCIATKNIYLDPKNDYSTEEKVIGTWIDGSTIYQRTIDAEMMPNNEQIAKTVIVSGISALISYEAFMYDTSQSDGSGAFVALNGSYVNASSTAWCYINAYPNYGTVTIRKGATSNRTNYHLYVTIRYTKTT